MANLSLKAHYDSETIRLDEPFDLPKGAQVRVTVLEPPQPETDRAGWIEVSKRALGRAYGDSEPEYSIADILP